MAQLTGVGAICRRVGSRVYGLERFHCCTYVYSVIMHNSAHGIGYSCELAVLELASSGAANVLMPSARGMAAIFTGWSVHCCMHMHLFRPAATAQVLQLSCVAGRLASMPSAKTFANALTG